jgi:hypothetical protein
MANGKAEFLGLTSGKPGSPAKPSGGIPFDEAVRLGYL